jgi:hypothetical protein
VGEAFVAMADDASALHYNPAGLALRPSAAFVPDSRRYELLVTQALYLQGMSLSQMGFLARPFGVSFTNLRVGGLERRSTESESSEGTFGASDLAFAVSYARQAGGTGLGVTGRLINESIAGYSATAFALDFGALRRLESLPLSWGVSVANLGTKERFVNESYALPLTMRLGATAGLTKRFPHAVSLELDLPRDSAPVLRLGVEYLGFGPLALRAGYRTSTSAQKQAILGKALGSTASGLSEFYGLFTGVGLRSRFGSLDYALLPYGELGQEHRLSLSVAFGKAGAGR